MFVFLKRFLFTALIGLSICSDAMAKGTWEDEPNPRDEYKFRKLNVVFNLGGFISGPFAVSMIWGEGPWWLSMDTVFGWESFDNTDHSFYGLEFRLGAYDIIGERNQTISLSVAPMVGVLMDSAAISTIGDKSLNLYVPIGGGVQIQVPIVAGLNLNFGADLTYNVQVYGDNSVRTLNLASENLDYQNFNLTPLYDGLGFGLLLGVGYAF